MTQPVTNGQQPKPSPTEVTISANMEPREVAEAIFRIFAPRGDFGAIQFAMNSLAHDKNRAARLAGPLP